MAYGMMRPDFEARPDPWGCPSCSIWLTGRRRHRHGRHRHHTGAFPLFPLLPMALFAAMMLSRSSGGLGSGIGIVFGAALVLVGFAMLARLTSRLDVAARRVPEESIPFGYARGQMTERQYQDARVGVLNDRFVRGVIDLDEYERQVAAVFSGRGLEAAERPRDDHTLL